MDWINCKERLPEKEVTVFLWSIHWGTLANRGELCFGYLNEQGYFVVTWHEGQPGFLEPVKDVSHWAVWPTGPED